VASRTGGLLLALAQRDPSQTNPGARDLHALGTVARVREDLEITSTEHRIELDGLGRMRAGILTGGDLLVAEAESVAEGDAGQEWARPWRPWPLPPRPRRPACVPGCPAPLQDPMAWVNLACQHLPITSSARQRLLEASAADRCAKISRGLDALLRKEHFGGHSH